jgi:hypothetical protein
MVGLLVIGACCEHRVPRAWSSQSGRPQTPPGASGAGASHVRRAVLEQRWHVGLRRSQLKTVMPGPSMRVQVMRTSPMRPWISQAARAGGAPS